MGAIEDVVARLRYAFQLDKDRGGALLAKGSTSPTYPDSGYDLLQSYGYDALSDYLRLEHDLLSRYVDYEEMDEVPEICSAIDIYADDSSQPETQIKRTVWVTSQDKSVQNHLDDWLHKRLRMDEEIWEIARTLVKYGNNYEELLVTGDGVVGMNFLPPPTVRRIEGPRGELHGFIQDFKGRFSYSPQEFQKILAQRTDAIRNMGADMPASDNFRGTYISALEPWEVVHFRLRGKQRRSVYGYCLSGRSRVWTPEGIKEIRDIQAGDRVFTRHAGRLLTTKVLDQVCSGTKPVYKLTTTHREIHLTREHPVLVDRGNARNTWVPAGDVKLGDKIVVAAKVPEMHAPPAFGLRLLEMSEDSRVRLTERGTAALRPAMRVSKYGPRDEGLGPKARTLGISRSRIEDLLEGKSGCSLAEAKKLFGLAGVPFFEGATQIAAEDDRLQLPDFVEPWVCRLWGFLTGDGWLTDKQIYFALGVNADRNVFYEGLFSRLGLTSSRLKDSEGVERQSFVSSKALVDVFRALGWIDDAHEKRIPSWIFCLSEDHRKEFIQGFMDADGWSTRYEHTELCNAELVRDIKNLVDGLGWTSGSIRERGPRSSTLKNGRVINGGSQYTLTYHKKLLVDGREFGSEEVTGFELIGEEPVYDIEVANQGHNFISDGVVVHNSVLEGARWIWKRLSLMEDAALIYRLQRAQERYAFYVDVGDMPPAEALAYVNQVRQKYRKKKFVNPSNNKLDLQYTTLAQDEDFYVPSRKGTDGTRIEVLGSPSWQHMDDVNYFKSKLLAALKVPKAYLAQEEGASKAVLSSEDVRFARSVLRVQRELRNGLKRMGRVHLSALKVDPSRVDFEMNMTVPSAIFELAQIEVRNARADLASRMREHVSLNWVLSNVYGLADSDIERVIKERSEDIIREGKAQSEVEKMSAMAQQAAMSGGSGGSPPGLEHLLLQKPSARRIQERVNAVKRGRSAAISEQELFRGSREAEKRAEEKLDKLLQNDTRTARRLNELGGLLRDVAHLSRKAG